MKQKIKKRNIILASFILLGLLPYSCSNKKRPQTNDNVSQRALKIKLTQYKVQGQQLYIQYCSNCHQKDGKGLGKLIPPLAQSDYMLEDVNRTICVIKNGLKGEIIVNGTVYDQPMNANEKLTDLEIAEIATYIYNSWEQQKGIITIEKVRQALARCPRP